MGPKSSFVFSTEHGKLCPECEQPDSDCICIENRKKQVNVSNGPIQISKQSKGRKGKYVTVISGLPLNHEELKETASNLRKICNAGGSIKNNNIEIQGDQRQCVASILREKGLKFKML